jgi:aminocarboxymuconate-semialdehyde decarboxylase
MAKSRLKIDFHCHILPRILPDMKEYSGYGGDWVQLIHQEGEDKANMMLDGKFFRAVEKNCWCVEERIRDMDRTGWLSKEYHLH